MLDEALKKVLENCNRVQRRKYFKVLKKKLQMTWNEVNSQLTKRVPFINHEKRRREGKE
jgi:hypothetical protein